MLENEIGRECWRCRMEWKWPVSLYNPCLVCVVFVLGLCDATATFRKVFVRCESRVANLGSALKIRLVPEDTE